MNRPTSLAVAAILLGVGTPARAGDERLIVLNKADATAMYFSPDGVEPLQVIETGDGPHEVAVSPDGKTAVVSNYGSTTPGSTLTVLDLTGATAPRTIALGDYRRPHGLAYFADGAHVLVTAEVNQSIVKVNVADGAIAGAWETGAKGSHMVVLAPGETVAYITNVHDGSVTKVDLSKPAKEAAVTVATAPGAEGLALSPDGKELWVCNNKADSISVVETGAFKVVATIACKAYPLRAAFTTDGKSVLAASTQTGELVVFDAKARAEARRILLKPGPDIGADPLPDDGPFSGSSVPIGIALSRDGGRAYIASTASGTVATVDLRTFEVVTHRKAGKAPDGIAFVGS